MINVAFTCTALRGGEFCHLTFLFQTLTLMLTLATACLAANLPLDVELPQGRYLHFFIEFHMELPQNR